MYKKMYPTTHGHAGATILTVSVIIFPNIIGFAVGGFLAFLSHFVLDYLDEYHYGSIKVLIKAQAYSLLVFIGCLILLSFKGYYFYTIVMALGYLIGNAPDIIDKKIGAFKHARPKKERFSCHGGGGGIFSFKNWKLGMPTKIKLDKTEQTQLQFFMTVLVIILTIIILK